MEPERRFDNHSQARIKLTLRYSVQRQRLIVTVHDIENLDRDDTRGLYVKLYLLPERGKDTKRRTMVVKTQKSPVFEETFEYAMQQGELGQKRLEVSVCEERIIKNEPVGKVVVDLDRISLVLAHTKLFPLSRNHSQN
ncbi:synaptotagmin-1 [Dendroctonus ponderosae]|uniref:C2 domain-containing protein n=1 Tax=Dendroctonus ponderosae TaxID=77166 RepID=U4U4H1_DENPD|nr:synaptotagmin-1 [Dendroctonus ponderosae]ERL87952.1 hypothetical protein D910_05340 [Dendroctonus ponderosae]KAH1004505.1 hypothetical protein HUJ05_005304 [Dendroctonus ponderosae]